MSYDIVLSDSGIILCMHPANKRWRYSVTPSLIGWAHTQTDPYWQTTTKFTHVTITILQDMYKYFMNEMTINIFAHVQICLLSFHSQKYLHRIHVLLVLLPSTFFFFSKIQSSPTRLGLLAYHIISKTNHWDSTWGFVIIFKSTH